MKHLPHHKCVYVLRKPLPRGIIRVLERNKIIARPLDESEELVLVATKKQIGMASLGGAIGCQYSVGEYFQIENYFRRPCNNRQSILFPLLNSLYALYLDPERIKEISKGILLLGEPLNKSPIQTPRPISNLSGAEKIILNSCFTPCEFVEEAFKYVETRFPNWKRPFAVHDGDRSLLR